MSEKMTTKSKADLLKMLAEAVRNTQPQPVGTSQTDAIGDTQSAPKPDRRAVSKRTAKTKKARPSVSSKQRRR
jgi:hypothetical protein